MSGRLLLSPNKFNGQTIAYAFLNLLKYPVAGSSNEDGSSFDLLPVGAGGGLAEITGTSPIVLSPINNGEQDVSILAADATTDGYMSKEAWQKLDSIGEGGDINVDPTQEYSTSDVDGTLTLSPGGDTTVIPAATTTEAGLLTAADKTVLDNLVASPGGVLSVVPGLGVDVNTDAEPGSASTPEILVKFAGTGFDDTTLVMPSNIQLLEDLI